MRRDEEQAAREQVARHRRSKAALVGKTQEQIASESGLSTATVSRVFAGQDVRLEALRLCAAACQCALADFVGPDVPVSSAAPTGVEP